MADSLALTALIRETWDHVPVVETLVRQGYDLGRKEGLREAARLARLAGGLPGYPIGDEFHAFAEQLDFLAGAV